MRAFSCISRGKSATFRASFSLLSVVPVTQLAAKKRRSPAKFANGSLLGNDSRIFVQHHGAYPLSRMRPFFLSLLTFPVSPRRFPSAHFSFSKFHGVPRRRRTSSLHFLLCPFSGCFPHPHLPPAVTLCTLDFVCTLDFLPFTYHLGFCNNNVPTTSIIVFLYIRTFFRFFCFYAIISSISQFRYVPFLCPSRSLYIPVGNCPSFLVCRQHL